MDVGSLSRSGSEKEIPTETSLLRSCPLCGSQEFSSVFDAIKRCKRCQLCFVNPLGNYRGSETEDYFLNNYVGRWLRAWVHASGGSGSGVGGDWG
jgi:hypothetical protein